MYIHISCWGGGCVVYMKHPKNCLLVRCDLKGKKWKEEINNEGKKYKNNLNRICQTTNLDKITKMKYVSYK